MAQNKFYGVSAPVNAYVRTDAKNSKAHALYVGQGGIGLPDREYYLRNDEESMGIQEAYRNHIATMAELTGISIDENAEYALEYALAESMKSRVEMRDAEKRYNPMTIGEWQELCPSLPITQYMSELGLQDRGVINSAPEYFSRMESKEFSLETWKQYHKWHIIRGLQDH